MRPKVKSRKGMRKGKGFSRQELSGAKIDIKDIKRLHITFDKRRKTSYVENIETLKLLEGR